MVVVDTPPALRSEALEAVLRAADYAVLPTPPAPLDLEALVETVRKAVRPLGVASVSYTHLTLPTILLV